MRKSALPAMLKKKIALVLLLLLIIGYLMGPRPASSSYHKELVDLPVDPLQLEMYIAQQEAKHKIKPDNEARIVWFDSLKRPTPFSIVYLHGFSASQGEGDPIHRQIAQQFGCNLFLSRLAEHGIDTTSPLRQLTANKYWESAKEAFAVGARIGKKVILMGTSTGGTNALQLAAAYPDQIAAILLFSPNIAINNDQAWLLNNPWGLQLATLITGSRDIYTPDQREIYKRYWNSHYRLEAVVALEEMLETSMTPELFKAVHQPTLLLYYFKDSLHQDRVVKVSAMQTMFSQLSTPDSLKRSKALPNTGDHVLASPIKSKDIAAVQEEVRSFLEEILHLTPLKEKP
ncbi:MAG: alpha/beta hydrolase [Chitinophagaceae bacterium]